MNVKTAKLTPEEILARIRKHLPGREHFAGECKLPNGEIYSGIVKKIEMSERTMTLTFFWTQRVRETMFHNPHREGCYTSLWSLWNREIPMSFTPEEIRYDGNDILTIKSTSREEYSLSVREADISLTTALNPPKAPADIPV